MSLKKRSLRNGVVLLTALFLSGCPGGTGNVAIRHSEPDQTPSTDPPLSGVDSTEVSDLLQNFERVRRATQAKPSPSCPVELERLPPGNYSGPVGSRVAKAAMDLLGYEERARFPPDGLKCAKQASNILKRAGVPIPGSNSVVGLIQQLRQAGWCESPRPIPGAIAYANKEFGNGPRSHVGVVSYVSPKVEQKVQAGMTARLKSRYTYDDPQSRQPRQLTIYHNSNRWIIGYPQGGDDREWFAKVKFLVPPESCGGGKKK